MKSLLRLLPRIFLVIFLLLSSAVSLANAYILFGPDTWPKPFHLIYWVPVSESGWVGRPEPTSVSEGSSETAEHESPEATQPGKGIMVDTGTKIVNLLDPAGRKYLRVGVVLEFTPHDPKYAEMEGEEKVTYETTFNEEVAPRIPVMNDIIITMLASQTFESIYTAEGKETLRQQIMDTINEQLPDYRVNFVYFTEFVVQ
jgi:flagellar basal body-associated protein FliL